MNSLADKTHGLLHPTPAEIRASIMEELSKEDDARKTDGLPPIPVGAYSAVMAGVYRACAKHYEAQK